MSDTCIVCLGDLSIGIDGVAEQFPGQVEAGDASSAPVTEPAQVHLNTNGAHHDTDNENVTELIAHLQPCGHDLHDECLKPWVERANSCPICRASFHLVQLMRHIGGTVISQYAVQDKTQVAEVDPAMFLEVPDEEGDEDTCQECGEGDNEDILMYCDGCDKLWHTYCVGLDEVPLAAWFCEGCSEERATDPQLRYTRRARNGASRRRTRGMERRRRNHNATHDDGWNQVWQSVWSRLNIDLDFPFDDDESHATMMRRHRQAVETNRREHDAYERRMRVAELAGAGNRFREIESTLLDGDQPNIRRGGPTQPPQETAEEVAAWNAFSEARSDGDQAESSNVRRRKRKSRTSSPLQRPSESPARESKRRRTVTPIPAPLPQSRPRVPVRPSPMQQPSPPRLRTVLDNNGPSFLQSLLQEVEDSAGPSSISVHRPSPRYPASPPTEQQSPRSSSPATSNPSSPRALSTTPPPLPNGFRPSSRPGLSSSILPVYPIYSPQRSHSPDSNEKSPELVSKDHHSRLSTAPNITRPKPQRPRIPNIATNSTLRTRSNDTSPTRTSPPANNKADVQKLVSTALKPHYHEQKISKDEYTSINRDVSRMLYDKIGDFEALDLEGRARWEKVASEEVNKAVTALKA